MRIIRNEHTYEFVVPQTVECVLVCGDIHGEFRELVNKLVNRYHVSDAIVIVAGDCGMGFHKRNYYVELFRNLDKKLSKSNIYLTLIRGNHDSPEYFRDDFFRSERIFCVPDYSIIRFRDRELLCVGGALSIDRLDRKADNVKLATKKYKGEPRFRPMCYWADETPVYDETRLSEIAGKYNPDVIVTHCAPSDVYPYTKDGLKSRAEKDSSLLTDCDNARGVLDEIRNFLTEHGITLTKWYYGHYHSSNVSYVCDLKYKLLDIMELAEIH